MTESILVPIDSSPLSMQGLEHALEKHPSAEIHVIHVVNPPDPEFPPWEGPSLSGETRERWENWTDELFEDAQDIADEYDVQLTTKMEVGRPARKIIEYAENNDIDGIVMGSHGRSGVSRILLGSVAESVMRESPVTVTVVRD